MALNLLCNLILTFILVHGVTHSRKEKEDKITNLIIQLWSLCLLDVELLHIYKHTFKFIDTKLKVQNYDT